LFHGAPGARTWRRILTVESIRPGAGLEVLDAALEAIEVAAAKRLEPA
jgi:tRNA-dihydrouridine synthase A